MRQKRRNLETEKYVAGKQAYALGNGLERDDLVRIIDSKGGDYYKAALYPDPGAYEAYQHIGMTGHGPTLDLQEKIIADMRAYYGLNQPAQSSLQPAVVAHLPTNAMPVATKQGIISEGTTQGPARYREMGELPLNTRHELTPDGTLISVGPTQGPAAAEAYKADVVQDILNTKGDEVSDLMREFEAQNDRDFNQSALLALLGLGSGVGIGQVLRPEEEEVIALSQT